MIDVTATKEVASLRPAARINNNAANCASVDRKGFDYAVFKLLMGTNDVGFTVMKLQESDDNSTWTDIVGSDYSVSGILPGASDQNKLYLWDVDLRGRRRYLRPAVTVGNGTVGAYVTILVQLSRAGQAPTDATGRGAAGLLVV